jgi:bile acid:Na+ symporter, BASS family
MTFANLSLQIVNASIVCIMLLSGILLDPQVFRRQFNAASVKEFANLALASFIVIPAIVIALLWKAPLDPHVKMALVILAMLPCAPVVPAMADRCAEPPEWSLFVLIAMSLLNIAVIPVLVAVLGLPWLAGDGASISGEQMLGILKFFGITYVPMGIGLIIRLVTPQYIAWLTRFLRSLMGKFLVASFAAYMAAHYQDMLALGWREFAALLVLETICVSVCLLFVRSPPNHRVTAMLGCAMRNFAMAIAFSTSVMAHTRVPVSVMAFTMILFWMVAISVDIQRRRLLRRAPSPV